VTGLIGNTSLPTYSVVIQPALQCHTLSALCQHS